MELHVMRETNLPTPRKTCPLQEDQNNRPTLTDKLRYLVKLYTN